MSKIIYICKSRGTLEMCHIMKSALDNGLLENINHDELETLLTEVDDITIFKWISGQWPPCEKFQAVIATILKYVTHEYNN